MIEDTENFKDVSIVIADSFNFSYNDEKQIHQLKEWLCEIVDKRLKEFIKTCLTCKHWSSDPETCVLYGERPPAHIIITSCESWKDKTE